MTKNDDQPATEQIPTSQTKQFNACNFIWTV